MRREIKSSRRVGAQRVHTALFQDLASCVEPDSLNNVHLVALCFNPPSSQVENFIC